MRLFVAQEKHFNSKGVRLKFLKKILKANEINSFEVRGLNFCPLAELPFCEKMTIFIDKNNDSIILPKLLNCKNLRLVNLTIINPFEFIELKNIHTLGLTNVKLTNVVFEAPCTLHLARTISIQH